MIIGHQKIINFLNRSIERDMVSHAYLFFGPEHLGKFTVALDFAKKLTADYGEKINPDIIKVQPEIEEKKGAVRKKDIKVEQVREMQKGLSLTPSGNKMKVAIIDEADRMTISAQNALLKTLEEPSDKSVIILVAHASEKILATVKSRCILKNFNPVATDELKRSLPKEVSSEAVFWSAGRPGLALALLNDRNKLESFHKYRSDFKKIFQHNLVEKLSLAEELSKDVPGVMEELRVWAVLLRQSMLGIDPEMADQKKSLRLMDDISESVGILRETNSNPRVVLENLFLKF